MTQPLRVILDPDCPPGQISAHPTWNRWAAFTTPELHVLAGCVANLTPTESSRPLHDELTAELKRRQP